MSNPQHIAYELSLKSRQAAKSQAVSDFLNALDCYDSSDPDDISIAVRCIDQAFDLCEQADKIAAQMMQSTDHQKAIEQLVKRRPGYEIETYRQAISEAIFRELR